MIWDKKIGGVEYHFAIAAYLSCYAFALYLAVLWRLSLFSKWRANIAINGGKGERNSRTSECRRNLNNSATAVLEAVIVVKTAAWHWVYLCRERVMEKLHYCRTRVLVKGQNMDARTSDPLLKLMLETSDTEFWDVFQTIST